MKDSMVIGRFQPLHEGHKSLIQTILDEGKRPCVAIMDTPIDENNPYTYEERELEVYKAFGTQVDIIKIPPVDEVCYGRNVGYHVRRIYHDNENLSASAIRNNVDHIEFKPDKEYLEGYRRIAEKVHELSASQGFWKDGKKRNPCVPIALAHSELSEAIECLRFGNPSDKNIHDMNGAEVQLSDVLGILMDMEIGYGWKISEALLKKMTFNKSRGWMHGGKEF
jgi:cytidyltransferase-like protein